MNNDKPAPISTKIVPENDRLATVERLFGIHFPLAIEPTIYLMAERLTNGQYAGGRWQFVLLSNGGFYMYPDTDEQFHVTCENMFDGVLSANSLGITATMYAYSHLSFSQNPELSELCSSNFFLLREAVIDHPEGGKILGACD